MDVPAAAKKTVLVVEDMDPLRKLLHDHLEEEGYTVKSAATCAAAQRIAAYTRIDAVLSDIRLPDGSGVAFCEVLRTAYPHIGVIMMTGFANQPVPEWIGRDVPLLAKPVDLVTVSETLKAVLAP